MPIEYRDFEITVNQRDSEGKHNVLIQSPAGGFAGTFLNPIDKDELDRRLIENGLRVRSAEDVTSEEALRGVGPVRSTDPLDEIGKQLSQALFRGGVMAAYAASRASLGDEEGLRIKIRVGLDVPEYAELMSLPWEFLYDQFENLPIELTNNKAIVRDPIVPAAPKPLSVKPPLRVLVAMSDPTDYPPLRLGSEMLAFLQSNAIEGIDVRFLPKATIQELNDEMQRQEYHIFHFMGHGGLKDGKPVLVFKDSDGKGAPVGAQSLKIALTNSVRLVFLNACNTARIPEAEPFASIPTELLRMRIPAVVAMQFPISDAAAIKFCQKFYEALVIGMGIDYCMGEARRAIFFAAETKAEWGTPVLFMNSVNGKLFKIEEEPS